MTEEIRRLKSQRDDALITLVEVSEELHWGDAENAIDRVIDKFIEPAIQRIKGESGGTGDE